MPQSVSSYKNTAWIQGVNADGLWMPYQNTFGSKNSRKNILVLSKLVRV